MWLLSKSLPFLFLFLSQEALATELLSISDTTLQQWASSSQWRNLLHYRKNVIFGEKSIIQGPTFFLSPEGSTNSYAELKATYEGMFISSSDIQQKTQCRYRARREFFLERIEKTSSLTVWPCPAAEKWLQDLHAESLSLIFASSYLSSAASSFGHTFFKFNNPKNKDGKEILDYAVNFAARTEDHTGALYVLYGLFGYFPGTFGISPFHQMTKEYTHLEGRDIWEYQLNFSAKEVKLLLYHLLELENSSFDYYFLDDNCSYALLKVLEVARPGLEIANEDELYLIPIDSVKRIRSLVTKKIYRPSLATIWKEQLKNLNSKQVRMIKEENWPQADLQTLEAAQDYTSLKQFENSSVWKEKNFAVSKERAKRGQAIGVRDQLLKTLSEEALAPDLGPDSARISLGYLESSSKKYSVFGFHLAFHDLLSRNQGASPFSHLEVLGFDFQSSKVENILLRRYRILEMLSTASVDAFDWPLSWGISLGGNSFQNQRARLQDHLLGNFGWSFNFFHEKIRFSPLFEVGIKEDEKESYQPVFGLHPRMWILWTPSVRSLFEYQENQGYSLRQSFWQFQQAIDLNDQLELRIGYKESRFYGRQESEKFFSLWQNL